MISRYRDDKLFKEQVYLDDAISKSKKMICWQHIVEKRRRSDQIRQQKEQAITIRITKNEQELTNSCLDAVFKSALPVFIAF
jgi:hypothetical protein